MPSCSASSVAIVSLAPHNTTAFIKFPWRVYRGDHLWVPPFSSIAKLFSIRAKIPFSSMPRCNLVEGFGASPVFQSSYNPPYYADFIEANGFAKCKIC